VQSEEHGRVLEAIEGTVERILAGYYVVRKVGDTPSAPHSPGESLRGAAVLSVGVRGEGRALSHAPCKGESLPHERSSAATGGAIISRYGIVCPGSIKSGAWERNTTSSL
jgi:hypothetical protein